MVIGQSVSLITLMIVSAERPNASVLVIVMFFAKGNILPLKRVPCVSLTSASFDFVSHSAILGDVW